MDKLTTNNYWNDQYGSFRRVDVVRKNINLSLIELDKYFKKYLPKRRGAKFIEVGCAPGRWMHYFSNEFGYSVSGIEYTERGVLLTKKNLEALGVDSTIYKQDFLRNTLKKNSYNVVFSFGFIEHFQDIPSVVQKHVDLASAGGMVIIGIPNLLGINKNIQKMYSRSVLATHNLDSMGLELYKALHVDNANLLDVRYVGKLNLTLFSGKLWLARLMSVVQLILTFFYRLFGERLIPDNKSWSPYIFMIYRKND